MGKLTASPNRDIHNSNDVHISFCETRRGEDWRAGRQAPKTGARERKESAREDVMASGEGSAKMMASDRDVIRARNQAEEDSDSVGMQFYRTFSIFTNPSRFT